MTFTEAALAVLEREGRPTPVKEIAEKALAWNLLSHVGKTPVQTMSTQISAAVAKGTGKSPFVRVKPGVFALASWGGKAPGPSPAKQPQAAKQASPAKQPQVAKQASPAPRQPRTPDEGPASRQEAAAQGERDEPSGRKRRRRRRKKRGGDEVSSSPQAAAPAHEETAPQAKPERPAPSKPAPQQKPASQPAPRSASQVKNGTDEPDLADRIEAFLRGQNRPVSVEAIAEHLGFHGRSGRLLVEATIVADRMEQEQRGERPRLTQHRGGFSLAEREVSGEIIVLEQQVVDSVAKLKRLAEQKLVRRMRSLDLKSLAKLVALYLKRFGFGEAAPVERGGDDELHLSVQDRRRSGRFRTAIVVRRDSGKPLTAEAVTELRGALHHYLSTRGMIITSGQISDEARVEAEVQNLAPIALVDGESLARELIRFGVGIRERSVRLPVLDEALLSELGG